MTDPQGVQLTERDERRLLAKVGLPDSHGCMKWLAALDAYGYGQMSLHRDGNQYVRKAHRLMHELFIGPLTPGLDIDHVCGVRSCVAPAHLRQVTRQQNNQNLGGARTNSKSGIRGVTWVPHCRKWQAKVHHAGRSIYLGLFDDIDDAAAAAEAGRATYFTHNDRDRAGTK